MRRQLIASSRPRSRTSRASSILRTRWHQARPTNAGRVADLHGLRATLGDSPGSRQALRHRSCAAPHAPCGLQDDAPALHDALARRHDGRDEAAFQAEAPTWSERGAPRRTWSRKPERRLRGGVGDGRAAVHAHITAGTPADSPAVSARSGAGRCDQRATRSGESLEVGAEPKTPLEQTLRDRGTIDVRRRREGAAARRGRPKSD